MASPLRVMWTAALLAAVMTSGVVRTAPTGGQEAGKLQEAVVGEAGKAEEVDEAVGDALAEDEKIDKEETLLAEDQLGDALKEDEEEKGEIVEEAMDKVLNGGKSEVIEDLKEDIINDDDSLETEDDIITGSSSQPDASDYLGEPSSEIDLSESGLDAWYYYNLPEEPSEWSSDFEKFLPYYSSSYEDVNGVDDDLDNQLLFEMHRGLFDGVPTEELNNKVDQTVDEFLCMLGLCDDVRVYPDYPYDDLWEEEEPNESQFTGEGMIGNSEEAEEESEEEDVLAKDVKPEEETEEATNVTDNVADEGQAKTEGSRHRSKRDLSWDELEQDNDLLKKINSLTVDEAEEETEEEDAGLTAADRFEDLLEYFKEEAAENAKASQEEEEEELYIGVPEPVLDEIVRETTGGEFQDAIEEEEALEEEEDQANLENGIEEIGEFIEDAEDEEGEENWGDFLAPGSPYIQDTLKYDGYKRDDEREALKVYIESLQNLEGYRKRAIQGDDSSRSAADFLRQLVPRSPPNAIRYPKTGLEPFSREKYFPLFANPEGMAEDGEEDVEIVDIDQDDLVEKYNELMELLNNELEATVLISTIENMAAELGRDRQLLDELAKEEAGDELQLALDEDDREILDLVGISDSQPIKRTPRVIDYPDFNEYPPEFHRSLPGFEGKANGLSEEDLKVYQEYLNEAVEEAKWGDFVDPPRERREGEDSLPGPHGAYYVQGRMLGGLMKPKRDLGGRDADDAETDRPYILLDPSDLGYAEWPGDIEIFYDTRDGTYVMYPYPSPQDASVLSDEALLDALGISERNYVGGGAAGDEEEWGDFIEDNALQNDLQDIEDDLNKLEELQILTEIAAELKREDDRARQEETLLRALLGK